MPTTVLFFCTGCQTVYQASQTRSATSGAFKCETCSSVVYTWLPPYEYVDWKRVEGGDVFLER